MDNVSRRKRSEIMRSVKSKDSKIEITFRKALRRAGYRYWKNPKGYFGKPDIVLKSRKAVIFIDSCFWHGCGKHCRLPAANKRYWEEKIDRNKRRDKKVTSHYHKERWKIVRIWEHEVNKDAENAVKSVEKLM